MIVIVYRYGRSTIATTINMGGGGWIPIGHCCRRTGLEVDENRLQDQSAFGYLDCMSCGGLFIRYIPTYMAGAKCKSGLSIRPLYLHIIVRGTYFN